MTGSETKTCTKCGEEKPLPEGFYFEKGKPRGCCKDCHKAKVYELRDADRDVHNAKRKEWAKANPEKLAEWRAQHWARYGDTINAARVEDRVANPEKYREQERANWARHRERYNAERRARGATDEEYRLRRNASNRASRTRHLATRRAAERKHKARVEYRTHQRKRNRRYYRANRERWEILRQRYIARKNAVQNEPYTRREIWERDEGVCKGCGVSLPYKKGFHIDHVIPLSKGGPNTPANVQLLCPPCNREKWARTDWVPPRPTLF